MNTPLQSPAVEYPTFTVTGNTYSLCWGPAARHILQQWGYWLNDNKPIPVMTWAAATAGTVSKDGIWRSARFASPFDLIDQVRTPAEDAAVSEAVVAILKNILPDATLTLVENPAKPAEGEAQAA